MLSKSLLVLAVAACLLQYGASMELQNEVRDSAEGPYLTLEPFGNLSGPTECGAVKMYRSKESALAWMKTCMAVVTVTDAGYATMSLVPVDADVHWYLSYYCGGKESYGQWLMRTNGTATADLGYIEGTDCPPGRWASTAMYCATFRPFMSISRVRAVVGDPNHLKIPVSDLTGAANLSSLHFVMIGSPFAVYCQAFSSTCQW